VSEIILETGSVPDTNLFSYTNTNFPFINTHWLGGFIFYLLSWVIGLKGLILFKTIIILVSFGIVFYLSLKKSKNFWLVFIISFLAMGVFVERTDVRPEIFSFLFFALFFYILYNYRSSSKIIWALPFLSLLWVNTHVYFFLGPLLFLFFLVDKIFQQKDKTELKKFLIIGFLMMVAVLVNPNGIDGALYPITAMGEYGYTIVENQTPFFLLAYQYHKGIIALFFLMSFFLFISFLVNYKELKIFELLVAIFFCFFGMYAVRNFPIFALAAMPIMARNFSMHWFKFRDFLKNFFEIKRASCGELFLLIGCIGFLSGAIFVNKNKINLNTEARAENAVNFLIENNIQGNMFNNFDVGGYLIYRLYPEVKVFVDNRPEAYSVSFLQDIYIPMQEEKNLWEKYSTEYDFDFIFFEHSDMTPWARSFLDRIPNDKNWKQVYYDDNEVIFVKND